MSPPRLPRLDTFLRLLTPLSEWRGSCDLQIALKEWYATCVSIEPVLQSPSNLTFAPQSVGTTSNPKTVTMTNTGALCLVESGADWSARDGVLRRRSRSWQYADAIRNSHGSGEQRRELHERCSVRFMLADVLHPSIGRSRPRTTATQTSTRAARRVDRCVLSTCACRSLRLRRA